MATLLRGGTSFDAALQHVADELSPSRTGELFAAAAAAVRSGTSPFSDEILGRVLDPGEREMLCIGERNGLLVEQWGRVAQRRDGALERRLHGLGATLEPLLIALVGFIVGGAVFALYLPTFRVMDLL
jgi:type IV pilus assembly protein PilC